MCSEEICFCFDILCSMFARDSVEVYEKVGDSQAYVFSIRFYCLLSSGKYENRYCVLISSHNKTSPKKEQKVQRHTMQIDYMLIELVLTSYC
jgi:hypothetical protein